MNRNLTTECFPLLPMQQGMLFHYLKEPHSGVDIEQLVVHLPELIDPQRLDQAWRWLVQRHKILRVRFLWEGTDQPSQEVMDHVEVPFVQRDFLGLSKSQQDSALSAFLELDRTKGFDMGVAPMMRVTLFQLAPDSFTLVWTFHHALLDGRSYPVLLHEVFEAYEELASGKVVPRPESEPYRNYAEWVQRNDFSSSRQFWKEYLAGFAAPTPLVVDRKEPVTEIVHRQGESWASLDSSITRALHGLAERESLTTNSLLMGAWSVLLYRYSGEQDILFGATRACRRSSIPNAEETIGLFINTVPVRVKLNPEETILSVVKSVRHHWVEMRTHENSPLSFVKSLSQIPPGQQLFETLLVFENYRLDSKMHSLGGLWANRKVELHELTNFPITLAAYDGEELSFKVEFDRRRFDEKTVVRMLGHLRNLLRGMAENPESSLLELTLLDGAEQEEILNDFNTPAKLPHSEFLPLDGATTLHQLFEAQVASSPNSPALTYDGESVSYKDVNALANRLARRLVACGVKPDTLVGICLERSNELVISLLAILKSGGAYLPIDLAYPADRLAFMLEDAKAPVLLTQRSLSEKVPATKATVLYVDEIFEGPLHASDEPNLVPSANADNLAYVIYTSGTTGKPKGSLITHRNAVRLFSATEHWYGFNETDVWTLFHSSAFDFSVWEIWGALLYGGRLVVVPFLVSRSPEAFYELLASEQVTVLNQTPSAFRTLIQAEETLGQRKLALRYVIFGGEALEMQSLRPWFERHGDQKPQLVNMYGITETTVHVSYRPISKDDLVGGSVIGVPIPDLQIYILDSEKRLVPIGVPGEMYVGGAGLARGYLGRPELTAQRFIPNHLTGDQNSRLYKTGDLARFLPGRDIEYLGRIDDQVKIRGFRIELGEIESVLVQHPSIREVAVIAREDVPGAKRLVAYLVAQEASPEIEEIRAHLKKKVPEYMVPAAFVFLEKLPLTTSGKIDRKALPAPDEHRPDAAGNYVDPRTPAEEKLARVWSKVLRIEKVGVNDNFFALGGDSILSIQVISLARGEGLKLTPKLLFANQTIAELAVSAGSFQTGQATEETPTGDVPLTPIQRWFFEQDLTDAHHYNQAFLFDVAERMEQPYLERAVEEVSRQHDALRLRFFRFENTWRESHSNSQQVAPLEYFDLSQIPSDNQSSTIEMKAASIQASLNIENGPIWRVVYFDLGHAQNGKLLIVVHHLVIDGVSWRPLLEDLETAFMQLKSSHPVQLPSKTSSFGNWAKNLNTYAQSETLHKELAYWKEVADPRKIEETRRRTPDRAPDNTEGSAKTFKVALSLEETQQLLQRVPAAYNTQINDVLLTALAEAWRRSTKEDFLFTNLEGHGRESLFDDVDVSRTVGWFTSLFPLRIELPQFEVTWRPGEALKYTKGILRRIPEHGIGFGLLRYLAPTSGLSELPEPAIVFNYLGQFDQVLANSKLFRFASESSGAWHSPRQRRRFALEVNSMVIDGRLELTWTYCPETYSNVQVKNLSEAFSSALRELIAHCLTQNTAGRTTADYPLVNLEQSSLDKLLSEFPDLEDIYPLSPVQTLFYSANPNAMHFGFDQWQCSLKGNLDILAFQQAWHETVNRHTVLRSSIHGEGLQEPVQVVHQNAQPSWTLLDWRNLDSSQIAEYWTSFLKQDRTQPMDLRRAPIMRFALARVADEEWKFLWSAPALLLDGWSWPLVFRDASRSYGTISKHRLPAFDSVRPYRDYLLWLQRQSSEKAHAFWRQTLAGFREPIAWHAGTPESARNESRFNRYKVPITTTGAALQSAARRLQVTVNALVQGAWALLLARHSDSPEVVFGSAFAGRPIDLPGADGIVGPFANALPVRVAIDTKWSSDQFFRAIHSVLLELSEFQYTPLIEIQKCSEVPLWKRLFDSMVVFQNYTVDDSARSFGSDIRIEDFDGPIHTNFRILLLVEPRETIEMHLVYDSREMASAVVEQWARDLRVLLENIGSNDKDSVSQLLGILSEPVTSGLRTKRRLRAESQAFVPPQTEMERAVCDVWQKMFGLDQVSVEENLFDLGGHSLLLVQLHKRMGEALNVDFPIVKLFEYPTVRLLSRHLETKGDSAKENGKATSLDRSSQQRQALRHFKARLKK